MLVANHKDSRRIWRIYHKYLTREQLAVVSSHTPRGDILLQVVDDGDLLIRVVVGSSKLHLARV